MPNTSRRGRKSASPTIGLQNTSVFQRAADTAPERRRTFRLFLAENGLTPTILARQLGLRTPNSFYNFLNGRSQSLSQVLLEMIQQRYPTLPVTLQPGDGSNRPFCRVVARAAPGLEQRCFRSDEPLGAEIVVPVTVPYPHSDLFGVRVVGDGAERFYPAGSILVCGVLAQGTTTVPARSRLVISRLLGSGIEVSIREYRMHDGRAWLWSASNHPDHQQPLTLDDVTLEGIVLASWQPEPWTTPS